MTISLRDHSRVVRPSLVTSGPVLSLGLTVAGKFPATPEFVPLLDSFFSQFLELRIIQARAALFETLFPHPLFDCSTSLFLNP